MNNNIDLTAPENLQPILVDIISGDTNLINEYNLFETVDFAKINKALDYILHSPRLTESQKLFLMSNSWRINYRDKPPTPEEFLTPKYLGRMPDFIYPRIKQCFIEFLDPNKPYRNAVLYPHIGWGKSTLAVLVNLYIITHLSMMRDPKKFFGQAPSAQLGVVLASYSLKKAAEVLLSPFESVLETSEFFEKVRTKEDMVKMEKDFQRKSVIDKIYWTTASRAGISALQFSNGANVKLISSVHNLLGLAQPLYSKIQKPDKTFIHMGDLKVGDTIRSPSEGETTVTGIFPQGKISCYEITLDDGRKTRCSSSHLWKVAWEKDLANQWIWKIVTTQFMIDHPDIEFEIYDSISDLIKRSPNA